MPRPKRKKVVSADAVRTRPTRNQAGPSEREEPVAKLVATKTVLKKRTSARTKASLEDSTMSGALPVAAKPVEKQRTSARTKASLEDSTMSGALPVAAASSDSDGIPQRTPARKSPRSTEHKATEELKGRRQSTRRVSKRTDQSLELSATAQAALETMVEPRATMSPRQAVEPPRTHPEAERTPERQRQSSPGLYSLSPDGEVTQAKLESDMRRRSQVHASRVPGSTLKVQSTPGIESSIHALTNFRRRPRQPSFLRMVQQHGDSVLSDLEGLEPDDEGTPLHLGRRRGRDSLGSSELGSGESMLGSVRSEDFRSSASRKRKRLSDEVQVPRSPSPVPSPIQRDLLSSPPGSLAEFDRVVDTQEQEADLLPANAEDPLSETNAPPLSSSASHTPVTSPRRSNATPTNARNMTRPRNPSFSTAKLQSLLPQRRHRLGRKAKNTFAIRSDTESEKDSPDVLARSKSRPRKKQGATPARWKSKSRSRGLTESPAVTRKSNASRVSVAPGKKVYGRRSQGEVQKENDITYISSPKSSDADDNFTAGGRRGGKATEKQPQPADVSKSTELQAAAAKFAEVDEWEMEFESVSQEGWRGSSPWR